MWGVVNISVHFFLFGSITVYDRNCSISFDVYNVYVYKPLLVLKFTYQK